MALDDYFDSFHYLDKVTGGGGGAWGGGGSTSYQKGAPFKMLWTLSQSTEALIAERKDQIKIFRGLIAKDQTAMEKGTVFQRNSDGMTFRATSDPQDAQAPNNSSMQVMSFSGEQWDIPAE